MATNGLIKHKFTFCFIVLRFHRWLGHITAVSPPSVPVYIKTGMCTPQTSGCFLTTVSL